MDDSDTKEEMHEKKEARVLQLHIWEGLIGHVGWTSSPFDLSAASFILNSDANRFPIFHMILRPHGTGWCEGLLKWKTFRSRLSQRTRPDKDPQFKFTPSQNTS